MNFQFQISKLENLINSGRFQSIPVDFNKFQLLASNFEAIRGVSLSEDTPRGDFQDSGIYKGVDDSSKNKLENCQCKSEILKSIKIDRNQPEMIEIDRN